MKFSDTAFLLPDLRGIFLVEIFGYMCYYGKVPNMWGIGEGKNVFCGY